MVKKSSDGTRARGTIERRGNSLRIKVYAGVDPLTGKRLYLRESTTDEAEAERILARLLNEVDEQRNAKTRATLRRTFEEWLQIHEVDESTRELYDGFLAHHIGPLIGDEPVAKITPRTLEQFYAELRRCRAHCDGQPGRVDHRTTYPHECHVVKHKRPARRPAAGDPPHDCEQAGCEVKECPPHVCRPLSPATITKIHFALRGAMGAAVRWEWITKNPAEVARKPRQPAPQPEPPTPEEANTIIAAAWEEDPAWGTLVWLVAVTGLRRGEVLGLRWSDIDLQSGTLKVHRNHVRIGRRAVDKDTKTHQMRRVALDETTVELLQEHYDRYSNRVTELGVRPDADAYVFSYSPTHDRACNPTHTRGRRARTALRTSQMRSSGTARMPWSRKASTTCPPRNMNLPRVNAPHPRRGTVST